MLHSANPPKLPRAVRDKKKKGAADNNLESKNREAILDETLKESFPASDPPSSGRF